MPQFSLQHFNIRVLTIYPRIYTYNTPPKDCSLYIRQDKPLFTTTCVTKAEQMSFAKTELLLISTRCSHVVCMLFITLQKSSRRYAYLTLEVRELMCRLIKDLPFCHIEPKKSSAFFLFPLNLLYRRTFFSWQGVVYAAVSQCQIGQVHRKIW